jgi:hypothetical protein
MDAFAFCQAVDSIAMANVLRVSGARVHLLVSLQLTEVRWTRLLDAPR